jgi:hypothetical protein
MRSEGRERLFRSYLRGLMNRQTMPERELFDRGLVQTMPTSGRTIRLRPHSRHFMPVLKTTPQGRHCGIGRAHEDQTHKSKWIEVRSWIK